MSLRRLLSPVLTIEDDRGHPQAVKPDLRRRLSRSERSELSMELRALWRRGYSLSRVPWVLTLVILGALGLIAVSAASLPRSTGWVVGPLVVASALGSGYVLRRGIILRDAAGARAYPALMMRHALCPCCSYDLAGVSPARDGCVICPECGAAWRLNHEHPKAV